MKRGFADYHAFIADPATVDASVHLYQRTPNGIPDTETVLWDPEPSELAMYTSEPRVNAILFPSADQLALPDARRSATRRGVPPVVGMRHNCESFSLIFTKFVIRSSLPSGEMSAIWVFGKGVGIWVGVPPTRLYENRHVCSVARTSLSATFSRQLLHFPITSGRPATRPFDPVPGTAPATLSRSAILQPCVRPPPLRVRNAVGEASWDGSSATCEKRRGTPTGSAADSPRRATVDRGSHPPACART